MQDNNTTTNVPAFITNQGELAQIVGVTPQYLSMAKRNYLASDALVQRLVAATAIPSNYWMLPRYKVMLSKMLKEFFQSERAKKAKAHNTQPSTITN